MALKRIKIIKPPGSTILSGKMNETNILKVKEFYDTHFENCTYQIIES